MSSMGAGSLSSGPTASRSAVIERPAATPPAATAPEPPGDRAGLTGLRLVYVGYFAAFGVSIPFFPAYLRALGLGGGEVALLLSVGPLFHLGVPLAWGWVADRTRRPALLLRIACAGAGLALLPLAFARTLPALVGVYAAHQLFGVTILGLLDSLALERAQRAGGGAYTWLRLWGSASFLVTCWAAGAWLSHDTAGAGGADGGAGLAGAPAWRGLQGPLVPLLMAGGYALAALAALAVRGGEPGRAPPHARDLGALLANRRFLLLLPLAALHWATMAPYHGFLGLLALHRGWPPSTISHAFMVGVVAEIAAFFAFPRLARRASLPALMLVATAGTAARWLLIARSHTPAAFVALQLLHALSFGVFWGAAVAWLADVVPPSLRATGQTVFTTATFGVGNLIGFNAAGLLYDAHAGPARAFAAGAALELVPLGLALTALVARGRGAPAGR
jgi:MFS transporter, PPP family, 3-phenylpropionic acid transporter